MKKQLHLAAQYLAAAGISFLNKKEDDSHTNLGFIGDKGTLETHLLSESGDVLVFNYNTFSLEWESLDGLRVFPLDGKTHVEVVEWIKRWGMEYLGKQYTYNLHYDLPYSITNEFQFSLNDKGELSSLCNLRTRVNQVLRQVLDDHQLKSAIRVWPHHFDTGAFSPLSEGSEISIGFGMAIPDSVSKDHYYYISGYLGHSAIEPKGFKSLAAGSWMNDGFTGAILPVTNVTEAEAVRFFGEAIDQFRTII